MTIAPLLVFATVVRAEGRTVIECPMFLVLLILATPLNPSSRTLPKVPTPRPPPLLPVNLVVGQTRTYPGTLPQFLQPPSRHGMSLWKRATASPSLLSVNCLTSPLTAPASMRSRPPPPARMTAIPTAPSANGQAPIANRKSQITNRKSQISPSAV